MSSLPETRVCTKCRVEKPLDAFHRHKKGKNGRSERCKLCRVEETKVYRDTNREKVKESNRKYFYKNREKKNAERAARYWGEDPEIAKAKRRNYYLRTVEKQKETSKEWRKNNPVQLKVQSRKRRALKKDAISEPYTEQDIFDRWGTDCHLCGEPVDLDAPRSTRFDGWERGLHLEHVVALSAGGPDIIENVKPSHGLCNLRKGY